MEPPIDPVLPELGPEICTQLDDPAHAPTESISDQSSTEPGDLSNMPVSPPQTTLTPSRATKYDEKHGSVEGVKRSNKDWCTSNTITNYTTG
jgi:hypothetical protein